ncbi:MAG: transporter substrate-binding domain-containing protein [Acidobacteriota bacterium]
MPLFVRRLLVGALAAALGCSESAPPASASESTLRVCVRPNPGFLELGPEGPAGLEYDLLGDFARAHGLRLELLWLDHFKTLLPSVMNGACDIGASCVTATDARRRQVLFSEPYFPSRVLLVEPREQVTVGPEALAGQRIAVVRGTLQEEIVSAIPGVEVVSVAEDRKLFEAIRSGDADSAVCDSAIVLPFLQEFPELAVRFPLSERSFFAFALTPDSPWKAKLDVHLQSIRSSGLYRQFLVKNFGEDGAAYILESDDEADDATAD